MLLSASAFGLQSSRRADEQETPTFRTAVTVVTVPCIVEERGEFASGLRAEDFELYDEGRRRPIDYFVYEGGEEARPLTLALLLDTSGSLKGSLGFEQDSAVAFLEGVLRPKVDMAAVIQFDSEISLVQDFTFDLDRLEQAIRQVRAGGATKLYDAVWVAVEDLLQHEVGRRVMVVLSDGDDTASQVKARDAIRKAQEFDVQIFGIGVRTPGFASNFGKLSEFARETGGLFFNSKNRPEDLERAFTKIHEALRHQYTLGFTPVPEPGVQGGFHELEVKVKRRGLKVRCREGYYAQGG
ncbi:MAG: hypothetical protein Kow00109_00680 [Acidobacteriota bacterium]